MKRADALKLGNGDEVKIKSSGEVVTVRQVYTEEKEVLIEVLTYDSQIQTYIAREVS